MTGIDALIKRLKRETPRLHCGHDDSVTLVRCDRGDCKCDEDEREQAAAALEQMRDLLEAAKKECFEQERQRYDLIEEKELLLEDVERMRDELAEATEAFLDQMNATATYMDKMEAAEAEVVRLKEALRKIELLSYGDGSFKDDALDARDIARAALAQRSET